MVKGFLWRNLKGRVHFEALFAGGRIILKGTLNEIGRNVVTGFIWIRVETSCGLL
jgi:hypothetical protein